MTYDDVRRRLQGEALVLPGTVPMGSGGIPGARPFEGTRLCSGCSHIPHEPGLCGGHSLILSDSRCGCTFDRAQTYVKLAR